MNETKKQNPMLKIISLYDFRLLFIGTAASLLGDQFALIATPWLVLRLTGDPLMLGFVLALEGLPRAVFMLVGGAVTDRISPRWIMLLSDLVRLVLTAWMTIMVLTNLAQPWMLYVFGLGFGLVAGFAVPAENSIVPMLLQESDLQAGNSIIMGIGQLAGFVGPTIAGILIGGFSDSLTGIGLAFSLDTFSFAVSAVCLWWMRGCRQLSTNKENTNIWGSILEGIKYLWDDQVMRMMFFVLLSVNFFLIGPLLVGIPVLADQRLPEGAMAYGLLMSAFAGGNLAGYLFAGFIPKPSSGMMKIVMVGLISAFGLVVGALGLIPYTWLDFSLLLLLGFGNGYIAVILFTWIQTRTPKEKLGRIMSLLMFCSTGLVPISQSVSGAICKFDLTALFIGAGFLVLLVAFWMVFQESLTAFCKSLVTENSLD